MTNDAYRGSAPARPILRPESAGATSRNEVTALRSRVEELREVAHDALEILGPCDTDNPHVEVWCINHQQKRCDVPALLERFAALAFWHTQPTEK